MPEHAQTPENDVLAAAEAERDAAMERADFLLERQRIAVQQCADLKDEIRRLKLQLEEAKAAAWDEGFAARGPIGLYRPPRNPYRIAARANAAGRIAGAVKDRRYVLSVRTGESRSAPSGAGDRRPIPPASG